MDWLRLGRQLKTMEATIGSLVIRGFISMFAHIYLLQYDLPARRLRVGWDLQQFDLSLTPSSSPVGSWSTRTGGSSELSRCWQPFVQEVKTWALSSSRFRRRLASTSSGSIPTWDLLGFILDKKIYLRPSGRLGNGISCNLYGSRESENRERLQD